MTAMPRRLGRVVVLSERASRGANAEPAFDGPLGGRTLAVHFQPMLARRGAAWRVDGAEALVRAYGDRRPALRPDRLLPAVERAGLMDRLFLFVLAESLTAVREWERAGLRLGVAVNVHAGALLDDGLPDLLSGLLDAADIAPTRVTLEITEQAPLADVARAAANLRRLRAAGVRAALDDFGAGWSTPERLARLQCDELKLDRALVRGLEHCEEQRAVVESLIDSAHSRGMAVCAEGVESMAALRLLEVYGCDRAQGFLVGRPGEASALPAAVGRWAAVGARTDDSIVQLCLPGLGLAGAAEA
jgi:EAL domain-containing protein (putative c-di-GMP-specific phosphodiesterase class I)